MKGFIEVTANEYSSTGYYSGIKTIIAINQILCVKGAEIYVKFCEKPIWCEETFEEIKEKIKKAQEETRNEIHRQGH